MITKPRWDRKHTPKQILLFLNSLKTKRVFCTDPVPCDPHGERTAFAVQAQRAGHRLQREHAGDEVLPVPVDGGLRGLRMELDYRSQEIRGELLFRRVSADVPAKVYSHAPHPIQQQDGHRAVLRSPKNVRLIHVVFRPRHEHHLRAAARNGGGQVRLQLNASGRFYAADGAQVSSRMQKPRGRRRPLNDIVNVI